jgi:hypothetical protein
VAAQLLSASAKALLENYLLFLRILIYFHLFLEDIVLKLGFETCAAAINLEDNYNRVPFHFLIFQLANLGVSPFILN